jgi:membrane-anchored glycerophosphoryl diester phosphodiesterase (GDPDase)
MNENVKLRVPLFIDDPLIGRFIAFFPIPIFCDLIIIQNRRLIYTGSKLSAKQNKSFALNNMKSFLLTKKKLTGLTKDFRLDPWGLIGTAV